MESKLKIGDKAPGIVLPDQDGKIFNLSDHTQKNVIVYFYPKDNTPGCTLEAKDFSALKNEFEAQNTIVVGISKDTVKSHTKFVEGCKLNVTLLSDEDTKVASEYGVYVQKSMFGKSYFGVNRSTFLIGKNGIIKHIWPKVNFLGHAKEVLKEIKKINALS